MNVQRFDGWWRGGRHSQAWWPLDEAGLATNAGDPVGFTLAVRAVGPRFQARVNDRLVLEATDAHLD